MGFVVGDGTLREGLKAKAILEAPDAEPVLEPSLIKVCRWIAEYYVAPLGMVLRTALPAALTGPSVPVPRPKTRRVASIRQRLPTLMERDTTLDRKSTRLNSSHSQISYAVFCLKKKKKKS